MEELKTALDCAECRERIKALEVKMNIITYLSSASLIGIFGLLADLLIKRI